MGNQRRRTQTRRFEALIPSLLDDLANLHSDNTSVEQFRQQWGQWYRHTNREEVLRRQEELRALWEDLDRRRRRVSPSRIMRLPRDFSEAEELSVEQLPEPENLYERWGSVVTQETLPEFICNGWLFEASQSFRVSLDRGRLVANPRSLPTGLALGVLKYSRRLAICRNPKCLNKYFIAAKRDQRYCSNECAWPAKKAAKRKWWKDNRGKKSRKSSTRKPKHRRKKR